MPAKRTKYFKSSILSNIVYCCIGKKHRKGEKDLNRYGPRESSSRGAGLLLSVREKYPKHPDHLRNSLARNIYDSGCQSSLQSNQSLEIKSHVLTKSVSQLSSIHSMFSIKWRRPFPRYKKEHRTFPNVLYKLAYKMKGKKKQMKSPAKQEKKNVLVIHLPKKRSNTSAGGPICTTHNAHVQKPLIIKDESSSALNFKRIADKPKKICRPGEVLFQSHSECFISKQF